jgi:hypothetical protein
MTSNKDKGKMLEIFVAERLQEIFQENPSIRPTKASSGGQRNTEIGDCLSQNVFVECKSHKGKWFSKRIWTKLIDSLPFGTIKIPLYVIEHEIEGKLIMLTFADFCKLLKEKND